MSSKKRVDGIGDRRKGRQRQKSALVKSGRQPSSTDTTSRQSAEGPSAASVNRNRKRRKRRSREDVTERICAAARQLFADRGFSATTTKEIALAADVSETLLFRYYGNKAILFDEVISGPINRMMSEFAVRHKEESVKRTREAVVRQYVTKLFEILAQNEELVRAAVATPQKFSEHRGSRGHGLEKYFKEAVTHLEMDYAAEAHKLIFDPRIAARLAFGMIASAVLLRDWLFPQNTWSQSAITNVLEHMIMRALAPREGR
jgi:AcrR family transcriptional regulator